MKKRYIAPIVALSLSLLYIGADLAGLVPPSKIDALAEFGRRTLFVSSGGETEAQWLQNDRQNFTCVFESKEYGHYCGFDIRVGDGHDRSKDLSSFTHLQVKLVFLGDGDHIRMIFRNAFSDPSVAPEGKQQDLLLPIENGLNEIFVSFDEFTVPQYWIDKYPELDEVYLNPERDNVAHMGFFYEEPNATGVHEFRIEEFFVINLWQESLNKLAYILSPVMLLTIALMRILQYTQNRIPRTVVDPDAVGDIRLEFEKLINDRTSELDVYDTTCGLPSRVTTYALLERYAENHALSNLLIMAVSLDNYHHIKSKYGVEVARQCQLAASITVKLSAGKQGVVCSWQPSQMLILLPNILAPRVQKIASEIRRQARLTEFSKHSLPLELSITVTSVSSIEDFSVEFDQASQNGQEDF